MTSQAFGNLLRCACGGLSFVVASSGPNPMIFFKNTATTPVVAYNVFQSRKQYFCFQSALGYPWHCKNLQRWRCNSRS
jgi:hypothetical protein